MEAFKTKTLFRLNSFRSLMDLRWESRETERTFHLRNAHKLGIQNKQLLSNLALALCLEKVTKPQISEGTWGKCSLRKYVC